MKKNNYSTIIDFGSKNLRIGVFDQNSNSIYTAKKEINHEYSFNGLVDEKSFKS